MSTRSRNIVELTVGRAGDGDAPRVAAVIAAYFHAERLKAMRSVWIVRLVSFALAWPLVVRVLALGDSVMVTGFAIFAGVLIWILVTEWSADRKLADLIDDYRSASA